MKVINNQMKILKIDKVNQLFVWGSIILLLSLAVSLTAYYTHIFLLNKLSFFMLCISILTLFTAMGYDLKQKLDISSFFIVIAIVFLLTIYFMQRLELHHFSFSVADASDYYIAGVCSVTRVQDIGFFLPLTASLSAVGFTMFGYEYAPLINVVFYSVSIPFGYFIFRKLGMNALISLIITFFIMFVPLSIWFSKTSFSEPIWQIVLLIYIIFAYKILKKEHINLQELIVVFLILMLAPFIRGEGVLYFGLIIFLSFYHFWKFSNLKSAIIISSSLIVLTLSIQATLIIRAHYLLGWQFNRIIHKITAIELLSLLYGIVILSIAGVFLLNRYKKSFNHLNLPLLLTLLSIVFKVSIAYIFSLKKHVAFENLLCTNEYGLMLGNFGFLITLLIIGGLILLYYRAMKGDSISLILVMMYTIFYLPFMMQAVTFNDEHAFFLYWNRYYFSIFMMIHLFSFGIIVNLMYKKMKVFIPNDKYRFFIWLILMFSIIFYSMDGKLYKIVTTEAHLKNSYKIFPWLKEKVGNKPLMIVYDSTIKYRQRTGVHDARYLLSRMLSVSKINVKEFLKIEPEKLNFELKLNQKNRKFLLCLSQKECDLENEEWSFVDRLLLPISWRRHFGNIEKAEKKHLQLYATLYKKEDKFDFNKKIMFNKSSEQVLSLLKEGWYGIIGGQGALSSKNRVKIEIPRLKKEKDTIYTLVLNYALLNTSKHKPKSFRIMINGKVVYKEKIKSSALKEYRIKIPNQALQNKMNNIIIEVERVEMNSVQSSTKQLSMMLNSLKIIKSK